MPYVERRDGVVTGLYANPQEGYAEEFLADDHPEVIAYHLANVKAEEEWAIDNEAVSARAKYASPLLLQSATYKEKYEDAKAFLAADPATRNVADYPYIASEAAETGVDPVATATAIKDMGDQWRAINAAIEGKRIAAKQLVRDALTVEAVRAVRPAILWP